MAQGSKGSFTQNARLENLKELTSFLWWSKTDSHIVTHELRCSYQNIHVPYVCVFIHCSYCFENLVHMYLYTFLYKRLPTSSLWYSFICIHESYLQFTDSKNFYFCNFVCRLNELYLHCIKHYNYRRNSSIFQFLTVCLEWLHQELLELIQVKSFVFCWICAGRAYLRGVLFK